MFFSHNNDNDISKIVVDKNKWIDCLFFGLKSVPFLPFLSLSNRLALKLAQKHNTGLESQNGPKRLLNLKLGLYESLSQITFCGETKAKNFPTLQRAWWFICTRIFLNTPTRYVNIM